MFNISLIKKIVFDTMYIKTSFCLEWRILLTNAWSEF
jgi:hypothetical protein